MPQLGQCSNAVRNQSLSSASATHRAPVLVRAWNDQQSGIAPRPEDFPLGSAESRAAARAKLERIQVDRMKNVIRVTVVHIGSKEANRTFEVYIPSKRENR